MGCYSVFRLCAFLATTLPLLLLFINGVKLQDTDRNANLSNMRVRLNANTAARNPREGRVEVSLNRGRTWGTVCGTQWTFREGNVVCRQLGLGYASMATQTIQYGNSTAHRWAMVGPLCRGTERRLGDCPRETRRPAVCNAQNPRVATVRCVARSPDLTLGLRDIEVSARLALVPMTQLTCAMEENCVSADAYAIRVIQPNAVRHLLRFTTKAENVGNADFSPYANYREWEWHQCHQHYHSMNTFATFDIYDLNYRKVAQGHKASFCLMDSTCRRGVRRRYTCGNMTQGISVGCADVYGSGLDCQWVDVTNLPANRNYILRVALNPEYKIGERSFENNGAECSLNYTGLSHSTRVTNCRSSPLWFRV